MPWFRHEATAHRDGRLVDLGDEFGPNGLVIWWQLNEACCLEDGPIIFPKGNMKRVAKVLSIDPDWGIDIAPILAFLVRTKLVTRSEHNGLVSLEPTNREKYMAPKSQTKEAQRERKRRQRAKMSRESHSDTSHPPSEDVTPYDTNGTDVTNETDLMVPTEPAEPNVTALATPFKNGTSQEQKLARRHLDALVPKLSSGTSYDLLHEFKNLWPEAWQEAIDSNLNPKSVGINLLGNFIATVTDSEPDWGRAGQLVGRFGRLALLGIDEGLIANADDPYRYAFRVCQNRATEMRATEKANG